MLWAAMPTVSCGFCLLKKSSSNNPIKNITQLTRCKVQIPSWTCTGGSSYTNEFAEVFSQPLMRNYQIYKDNGLDLGKVMVRKSDCLWEIHFCFPTTTLSSKTCSAGLGKRCDPKFPDQHHTGAQLSFRTLLKNKFEKKYFVHYHPQKLAGFLH